MTSRDLTGGMIFMPPLLFIYCVSPACYSHIFWPGLFIVNELDTTNKRRAAKRDKYNVVQPACGHFQAQHAMRHQRHGKEPAGIEMGYGQHRAAPVLPRPAAVQGYFK